MIYENYQFWGMHLTWWFVWGFLLFWMFATPYEVPFQRGRKLTSLEILKRRFASGQMTMKEYEDSRKMLERP